ncbi:hypothetical protein A2313_03960 [Candidatus Roizmanbacteria bacterium RIFOXYB2_FULL_41_10]|uniref:Nucleotidyl transferase domain-containing protein n=1 Tax=Candidatus Roizmanbacteria bacterium RIFOXYA1_FULL_41_12 TaxID=1802082 RepID=A0A1F7K278_9BACT|nr:MAG: hypothetical protein A2209_00605 [Candidatus Roizmanbacteria bacterium RIFOXYA1_FULL_41_12]OGK66599.1 MAG: hypothetical protein A2377_00225 [Candidatus Roizmanbacteria bacterium RIFOXYB1_FULL_41_27]OGK69263.1 MAG: hypothetical protein A2313_03960 [Candidatus Roizmanbacteria bacterium RIFOXYB2_FULL_41_10]OGK70995.1 MAG: hypothetical protein A2403_03800 [Candidatus Roizmanbacteria bacterium RIFOXYC1_FULL_41_16]OGK74613.1 MAG: hypothetical protein A2575_00980 [Candidatus Roizmanbacteria ba
MEFYVVILAGGLSNRFWPLEEKNLFEFFGTPLIIYQIKRYSLFLKRAKINPHFIVVTNERNHALISQQLQKYNLNKPQLVTQTLPDQSGAVISALKKVTKDQPILIVNSNDIFSESLISDFLKKVDGKKLVLTATEVNSYFPGGYLEKDSQGKIQRIVEKPDPNTVPGQYNLFRFVLDFFPNRQLLEEVLDSHNNSLSYEDAINLILNKQQSDLVINNQPFTSLKYPWHILEAANIFLKTIKESVVKTQELESSSQIVGKVFIAEGVKIGSFTKIVGPTYIGKNTLIGDHCLVRNSHIGADCLIGAHSEVARSYLGNKVMLHRNYVGDSVLSENTSFGANTVTANWRFDEQIIKSVVESNKTETGFYKLGTITGSGVKVGVSTSLMPGVKIKKNTVVSPQQTIYKDITK